MRRSRLKTILRRPDPRGYQSSLAQYLGTVSSSARDNIKLTNHIAYNQPDNYYKLTHKYNTNKNTDIIF